MWCDFKLWYPLFFFASYEAEMAIIRQNTTMRSMIANEESQWRETPEDAEVPVVVTDADTIS